jgi:hypothetical protein
MLFDLGAPGPATALKAGRWTEDPRRAPDNGRVAGPAPLPPRGRHVVAPDPFPGGRGSRPPRTVGAARSVMVRPSHVAVPDLPRESGSAGAARELSSLPGHVEAPDLEEHGEGPETMVPAVRPGQYATSPRRRGGDYGL